MRTDKSMINGILFASLAIVAFATIGLADQVAEFQIPIGSFSPGNSAPDTYRAFRYLDIGSDVDGSGSSINPSDLRMSNYAFTGEMITYYVLVRDNNGAADITQVGWVKDGSLEMAPCDVVQVTGTGASAFFNVPTCYDTKDGNKDGKIFVDEATNLLWDDQIDKIYKCTLEVESSWSGPSVIKVVAVDTTGATGKSYFSESWNFNPALSISFGLSSGTELEWSDVTLDQAVPGVTAPNCIMPSETLASRNCLNSEIYNPTVKGQKLCDVQFSENTLVLTNTGVVDLWAFIAATDFHSSSTSAKCPFTNTLPASQFEYNAIQGSWESGWRTMPEYSTNLGCNDWLVTGQCRGGCKLTQGNPIDILSPNANIQIGLKVVWPTPCIGTFDTGEIYAIVRAV